MTDLKHIVEDIDPQYQPAIKELKRLQKLVDINRRREKDTYSKMFKGGPGNDYIDEKRQRESLNYKSMEDLEFERER